MCFKNHHNREGNKEAGENECSSPSKNHFLGSCRDFFVWTLCATKGDRKQIKLVSLTPDAPGECCRVERYVFNFLIFNFVL